MTPSESPPDPRRLLDQAIQAGDRRAARLFAAACCRLVWGHLPDAFRLIVDVIELTAHARTGNSQMLDFAGPIYAADWPEPNRQVAERLRSALLLAVQPAVAEIVETWAPVRSVLRDRPDPAIPDPDARVYDIARCVFGLATPVFNPAWRTTPVLGIAAAIAEDLRFDLLPILADALQDSGCEDEGILTHCRVDSVHVRGCWVADFALGTPRQSASARVVFG